jgi:2-oxo-3-hexenedioate decarboxylase
MHPTRIVSDAVNAMHSARIVGWHIGHPGGPAVDHHGLRILFLVMVMAQGISANVLDGPLSALRYLVALLADDPHNAQLAAGEIVSTGTLTRALPVKPGETGAPSWLASPLKASVSR